MENKPAFFQGVIKETIGQKKRRYQRCSKCYFIKNNDNRKDRRK